MLISPADHNFNSLGRYNAQIQDVLLCMQLLFFYQVLCVVTNIINFYQRFSLHVFAAFLELSTTPEVNIAKKSTIELGYEIYQLRSAQCRNQGKILQCDFYVHECNFLFFAKCTTVCLFFKNQVPYKFAYIGLNFHQIVF